MKRVITLYRVSTKKQVDIVKDDIPLQKTSCHAFVNNMPDWEITKELEEKGISGFKVSANDRDAIQELKELALKKEFDVLLVFMFDRIGRIESETPFVVEWFISHGIEVWSVNEGQQKLEQHVDKLMNYIRYWQASGESEKTSIRVKTRLSQMVEDGIFTGGQVKFGYMLVNKGRLNKKGKPVCDLAPNPDEIGAAKMAFEKMYYEGYGTHQIATLLNNMGYKTKKGADISCNYVLRMLKNEIYRGYIVKGDSRSPHLPELQAVSDEVFFGVQEILKQRSRKDDEKRRIAMNNKSSVLLGGNIYCAHCGGRLVASRYVDHYRRKDGTVVDTCEGRYICYHRNRRLVQCDGSSTYKAKIIDEMVIKVIKELFSCISGCPEEEKIAEAYKKAVADNIQMQKSLRIKIAKDKQQLSKLQEEIANALSGESLYSPEDLSIAINTIHTRIDENEKQLEKLELEETQKKDASDSIIPAYKRFKTWADEFDEASFETKKMIANRLFERIEVSKGYKVRFVIDTTYQQFCEEWLDLTNVNNV